MQVWETWINHEFFEKDLLLLPSSITLRKNKFQFIAHIQTIRRERIYPFRKVNYQQLCVFL